MLFFPAPLVSQLLLDANYLTHDFSETDEDWARESQEAPEFLWRAFPEVHEMNTQAQTCGETQHEG